MSEATLTVSVNGGEPVTVDPEKLQELADGIAVAELGPPVVLPEGMETAPDPSKDILEILDLEKRCQVAEAEYNDLKEQASDAKKRLDGCVSSLRARIRRVDEPLPLFDGQPKATGDDAWRNVPLCEALQGISAAVLDKLSEAGLSTMGTYSDHCNANTDHSNPLTLIKGIGAATADKIREAEAAFWTRLEEANG